MNNAPGVSRLRSNLRMAAGLALDLPKLRPTAKTSPSLLLRRWAQKRPDALAIAYLDERHTWRQVDQRVDQYATWFAREGLSRGDVVALLMDNRPDYLFILMALSRIGAVTSLINTNVTGRALVHGVGVCGAKKVLVGAEYLERIRGILHELKEVDAVSDLYVQVEAGRAAPDEVRIINSEIEAASGAAEPLDVPSSNRDVYCYIYTSGTTGLPKAAIIRNHRMLAAGIGFGRLMHRSRPDDVIYVSLPLYHSSAMFLGWGAALVTGAGIALRKKFSVTGFWKDIRKFEATSFIYIGELCRYLLNAPVTPGERDHQLRVGTGNGMGPEIWEPFQKRFGVPLIREFYGATEGNAPIMNVAGRPRMIGKLNRGQVLVRCDAATGEVHRNEEGFCEKVGAGEAGLLLGKISRLTTFDGYLDGEATEKKILTDIFEPGDRYFNSGDLINLHDGGWLSFADRVGDTFRWKGENVSTTEVSDILGDAEGVE